MISTLYYNARLAQQQSPILHTIPGASLQVTGK